TDAKSFRLERMLCRIFGAHRKECADPDVQGDHDNFNSLLSKGFEHPLCEMKAGGGRGDSPRYVGADGLVFDCVGRRVFSVDVRRKRNMTVRRQELVGGRTDVKQSKTLLTKVSKNSIQFSIRKNDSVTFPNSFARTAKNFPHAFTHRRCKEHLDVA